MHTPEHLLALAQEITACHSPLALQPDPLQRLPHNAASFSQQAMDQVLTEANTVKMAVRAACRALDFIDADAQCVASAWQSQTERSGQFDATAWPCEPQDFGLRPLPRKDAFAACPHQLGLYAVLPDAPWVGRMARAGVPTLQLRFKSDDAAAVQREVAAAVQAVQGTGALLFINDHWQAALDTGAYGVHLGQEDLEGVGKADLAAIRAAGLRLGLSSHGYAEMQRADAVSPSYIALGAVYATTLKRMATPPQGPARLTMYAQLLRNHSTVAIGGVDAARLPEVLASGVGSVAVVRALVAADQPEAQAAELQRIITAHQLHRQTAR
ncbi:MAG: thiamine phosphate synthase [Rhodoferax sp.]|uniref:thiamine phosphate synthase n=1 Tax=Rhodoferax sp. TaxID=50421 RepID=UPI00260433DB|nr:thiamine phosphate synthase [Rhodoferax sp.]MDD2879336.1 thiamine phosphate synthase [Rhodoferax sp.]